MSRYRSLLEEIGELVDARPDAFERLAAERLRRQRNRRLAGAAVGLLVAFAGIGGAALLVKEAVDRGSTPAPRPADPSAGATSTAPSEPTTASFPALWPERFKPVAYAAQALVDEGQQTWRLDATAVATRFGREVLGWTRAYADLCVSVDTRCEQSIADHTVAFVHEESCADVLSLCSREPDPIVIRLERLVRRGDGGIWSVTRVDGRTPRAGEPAITLDVQPGARLVAGSLVEFPTSLPPGTRIAAGFAYQGECSEPVFPSVTFVEGHTIRLHVADAGFEEDCVEGRNVAPPGDSVNLDREVDGYLYLASLEQPTDLVPFGSPWAAAPANGYIEDFWAVPVRFVPGVIDEANDMVTDVLRASHGNAARWRRASIGCRALSRSRRYEASYSSVRSEASWVALRTA